MFHNYLSYCCRCFTIESVKSRRILDFYCTHGIDRYVLRNKFIAADGWLINIKTEIPKWLTCTDETNHTTSCNVMILIAVRSCTYILLYTNNIYSMCSGRCHKYVFRYKMYLANIMICRYDGI